jgi:cation diffusion facilitator CzcD-associated flavoprotein CzcO
MITADKEKREELSMSLTRLCDVIVIGVGAAGTAAAEQLRTAAFSLMSLNSSSR